MAGLSAEHEQALALISRVERLGNVLTDYFMRVEECARAAGDEVEAKRTRRRRLATQVHFHQVRELLAEQSQV